MITQLNKNIDWYLFCYVLFLFAMIDSVQGSQFTVSKTSVNFDTYGLGHSHVHTHVSKSAKTHIHLLLFRNTIILCLQQQHIVK